MRDRGAVVVPRALRRGGRFGWFLAGALAACTDEVTPGDGARPDVADATVDTAAPPDVVADAPRDARPDADLPRVTIETYPRVDGSTSTLPLARVIACELLGLGYRWLPNQGEEGEAGIVPVAATPAEQPLADAIAQRVVHSRTHQAYLNLVDARVDLLLVANTASDEEAAYARAHGVTLDARPVALDALVFVANARNPVRGLSTAQIQGIFMGEVTRWSAVGGRDEPIHPYVRPANSGSQQLMESLAMGGRVMPAWPPDRTVRLMGALLDNISGDPLSVGYSVFYFVTYQYPSDGYRTLAVDGVAPTAATIGARAYRFAAEVWVVTRADLDRASLAYQLRDWLLSPGGQQTVARSGYVPLPR